MRLKAPRLKAPRPKAPRLTGPRPKAPRLKAPLAVVVLAVASLLVPWPATALPDDFDIEVVAKLDFPTQMAFTPSGDTLFVNEKGGRIRVIVDGKLREQPFATIETDDNGEGGLLGIAVHPRFGDGEPWVYVFHSSADGGTDRVTRIRADGFRGGKREVVIEGMPASTIHHGGVIAFGPDGMLYVTNGDHAERDSAQQRRAFGGKVYRVEPDGSVPADNPFDGSRTWSYGHRNMFGIAFDLDGGLWISENGDDDHDEVNHIRKGRNYGWPIVEGNSGDDRFVDPVVDLEQIVVPTGIGFAGDSFPEEYRGDLFLATFQEGAIHRFELEGDRVTNRSVFHDGEQFVALLFGRDGLYVSTPEAVKLIRPRARPTPSKTPSEPSPTATPAAGGDETGFPWGAAIGALLAVGLLVALAARRARRLGQGAGPA